MQLQVFVCTLVGVQQETSHSHPQPAPSDSRQNDPSVLAFTCITQ